MPVDTDHFIENSTLDVLVPQATGLDIEELAEKTPDVVYAAEERSLLYFGMQSRILAKASMSYSFLGTC